LTELCEPILKGFTLNNGHLIDLGLNKASFPRLKLKALVLFREKPCNIGSTMKHRSRPPEQDDLLRPRLVDMIDPRHELVKLAALIDWEVFEREWVGFLPSTTGWPATSPRLMAGLLYPQHTYRLSGEAVVARWVENPYHQHFTGETFFQYRLPIDPLSLSRWRKRIGEEAVE